VNTSSRHLFFEVDSSKQCDIQYLRRTYMCSRVDVSRLKVLETLGSGNFGDVKKAVDPKTREQFAIKIFKKATSSTIVFERRIYQHMKPHDGLLSFFGQGTTPAGKTCFVLSFFDGKDLYNGGADPGTPMLPVEEILTIFRQIGGAFAFIHAQDIIHCDLKPENLLWNGKCVKVIDFGVSYMRDVTPKHNDIMAYSYRAPSMVHKLNYGAEIDVWSIACILHEIVVQNVLFGCPSITPMDNHGRNSTDRKIQTAMHQSMIGEPMPAAFKGTKYPPSESIVIEYTRRKSLPSEYATCRQGEDSKLLERFSNVVLGCMRWKSPDIAIFNRYLEGTATYI
jgi:serine/threonine protein kinase